MAADWWLYLVNTIRHIPIERVLFPPRNPTADLQKFLTGLQSTETQKEAPSVSKTTISPQTERKAPSSGTTEGVATSTASDFCPACGPEKHIPVSRKLLVEAGERFSNGKLTPDGIGRVRDAIMELRTYTESDLKYIEAEGVERDFWQDVKDCIIEIAHELGTSGRGFTIGHGSREELEDIRKSLEKVEAIAYEGVIRFGRKGVKHAR